MGPTTSTKELVIRQRKTAREREAGETGDMHRPVPPLRHSDGSRRRANPLACTAHMHQQQVKRNGLLLVMSTHMFEMWNQNKLIFPGVLQVGSLFGSITMPLPPEPSKTPGLMPVLVFEGTSLMISLCLNLPKYWVGSARWRVYPQLKACLFCCL